MDALAVLGGDYECRIEELGSGVWEPGGCECGPGDDACNHGDAKAHGPGRNDRQAITGGWTTGNRRSNRVVGSGTAELSCALEDRGEEAVRWMHPWKSPKKRAAHHRINVPPYKLTFVAQASQFITA